MVRMSKSPTAELGTAPRTIYPFVVGIELRLLGAAPIDASLGSQIGVRILFYAVPSHFSPPAIASSQEPLMPLRLLIRIALDVEAEGTPSDGAKPGVSGAHSRAPRVRSAASVTTLADAPEMQALKNVKVARGDTVLASP